jgi:plasmid stabilization system protein ParE
MSYRVIWPRAARNDLADIWLNAPDQNAVTAASAEIDRLLEDDPLHAGHPMLSSVHRRLAVPPLGVLYEVVEDDKRVIVEAVFAVS